MDPNGTRTLKKVERRTASHKPEGAIPHGREKIREEMKTAHEDAGDAASPRRSSNREVYKQISSLAGLGLLEACSFGIIIPMLPIVTTEVSHESVSIAAMRAWRSNGLSCYPL
jgi:hypothetical protein